MSQPYPTQPAGAPQPPPKPFNWRRWTLWTALAAAAAFGIVGGIAASRSDDKPDHAACKAALQRQYEQGTVGDPTPDGPPAECLGVDNKTMQRLIGEVMAKEIGDTMDGMFSSPSATP